MMKSALLLALLSLFLCAATASAQSLCPNGATSDRLICLIPQVYGPNGLSFNGALNTFFGHEAHFENSFLSNFTPLNSAIGSELTQLPLASPSSGIIFTYNPALKTFSPSTEENLGPILGERAGTIGRHRVYVGFSYQYFSFENLDGHSLKNLPEVYTHNPTVNFMTGALCSPNGNNTGSCGFVRDVIATGNAINLSANQFTTYLTFGLTRRIDVSMAIPILNVHMRVTSFATIVQNSQTTDHVFSAARTGCTAPCLNATFSNSRTTTGLGDIVVRVKGTAWQGERAGLGLGVDVRTPTGDELNFLGSGAVGVRPFAVVSYRARFSPHATAGYQWNGDSVLAGDLSGRKGSLPSEFTYSAGADVAVAKGLTLAFDVIGQRLFDAPRTTRTTFTDAGACTTAACTAFSAPNTYPNTTIQRGDFSIVDGSVGVKFRVVGRLVVTGNALIKLNDGGLRSTVVPLVGVSYSF